MSEPRVEIKLSDFGRETEVAYYFDDVDLMQRSKTAIYESAIKTIRDEIVKTFIEQHKDELLSLIKPSDVIASIKEKVGEEVAVNVLKPSWFGK